MGGPHPCAVRSRDCARAVSATQGSFAPAGTGAGSSSRSAERPSAGCSTSARWTTAPASGSMASAWASTKAATRPSPSTSPTSSTGSTCEIAVRADDDPHDLTKPRGKQDWQLEPHSIWYPRTSGIWQTVWLERVPATRIGRIAYTPDLTRWEIGIQVWLGGEDRDGLRLGVKLRSGDSGAGSRHVPGRQRRGPSRRGAVRSGHRRLAQRAALESACTKSDRRAAGTVGRARRADR